MKIAYTFRHMNSSEELKAHTTQKLERLGRFEDRELAVHVTFGLEKHQRQIEFQVQSSHGTFVCSEEKEDMFEAIDLAVDKIDRQLAREKSRRKHHKGNQAATPHEIG
jgi:ribosomal subunit interface protein